MRWCTYVSPADRAERVGLLAEGRVRGAREDERPGAGDLRAQEMKGRLGPAKGKDSATSFGAFLVTPDELEDRRAGNAYDLEMTASVSSALPSGRLCR